MAGQERRQEGTSQNKKRRGTEKRLCLKDLQSKGTAKTPLRKWVVGQGFKKVGWAGISKKKILLGRKSASRDSISRFREAPHMTLRNTSKGNRESSGNNADQSSEENKGRQNSALNQARTYGAEKSFRSKRTRDHEERIKEPRR